MVSRFSILVIIVGLVLLVSALVAQPGQAQESTACSQLVERAFIDMGMNCVGLDRNSACYGFNRVEAVFTEAMETEFFSSPGDHVALTTLERINTAALTVSESRWGIAVMNVQANVPNTLPGQAVTFILLGEVEVENAVTPEEALLPVAPIAVNTIKQSNVRSAPSTNANVMGIAPQGTPLEADGISPDNAWLRVLFENAPAWIQLSDLDIGGDLSSLPVIDQESRSPMQAFYLRTDFGASECAEAPPSVLFMQGPDEVAVDITANGADIRITSTIILRILPPGDTMQLIALSGLVILNPGTPEEIVVPPGFTTTICLTTPANLGLDGNENDRVVSCPWSVLRLLTFSELEALAALQNLPSSLLHYPAHMPAIICPSGAGEAICQVILERSDQTLEDIQALCAQGLLAPEVCQHFLP